MKDAAAWALAGLLAASCAAQAWVLLRPEPRFSTLPIFVPLSLEYEREMRAARGQPADGAADAAVRAAEALLAADLDAGQAAALAPLVERIRETRERLLAARNRRHALNVELMDVGVAVARRLEPEQWEYVEANRDALRARADAEVFDRLLEKLR